jgi:hypothetical protein|tara:strand:+ start:6943 stop:7110 length:168 start_codon:yes stop_codon:yes gene_type:complete
MKYGNKARAVNAHKMGGKRKGGASCDFRGKSPQKQSGTGSSFKNISVPSPGLGKK